MTQCRRLRSIRKLQRGQSWDRWEGHLLQGTTPHTILFNVIIFPDGRIQHGSCPATQTHVYPSLFRPPTVRTGWAASNKHAVAFPSSMSDTNLIVASDSASPAAVRRYATCWGKHFQDVCHCMALEQDLSDNLCRPTKISQHQRDQLV